MVSPLSICFLLPFALMLGACDISSKSLNSPAAKLSRSQLYVMKFEPLGLDRFALPSGVKSATFQAVEIEKAVGLTAAQIASSKVAISSQGDLFVYAENEIRIIGLQTSRPIFIEKVIAKVGNVSRVRDMSPSPKGDRVAFVVDIGKKELDLLVLNVHSGLLKEIAKLENSSSAVFWSADGQCIYPYRLTGVKGKPIQIAQFNLTTGEWTNLGTGAPVLTSLDEHLILVNDGDRPYKVISAKGREERFTARSQFDWHSPIAFFSDGEAFALETPLNTTPNFIAFNFRTPEKKENVMKLSIGKGVVKVVVEKER